MNRFFFRVILILCLLFPASLSCPSKTFAEEVLSKEEAEEAARDAVREEMENMWPELEGELWIEGTAQYGYTLTARARVTTRNPGTFSFTWYRDGKTQVGRGVSYTIKKADVGCSLSVVLTTDKSRGELTAKIGEDGNGGSRVHRIEVTETPSDFTMTFEPAVSEEGTLTYTVTIPEVRGAEYSFNGAAFTAQNVLSLVPPGTTVTGAVRYKETELIAPQGMTYSVLQLPAVPLETAYQPLLGAASKAEQQAVREAVKAEQQKKADEAAGRTEENSVSEDDAGEKGGGEETGESGKEKEEEDAASPAGADGKGGNTAGGEEETEEAGPPAEEGAPEEEAGESSRGEAADPEETGASAVPGEETEDSSEAGEEMEPETGEENGERELSREKPPERGTDSLIFMALAAALVTIGGFCLLVYGTERKA